MIEFPTQVTDIFFTFDLDLPGVEEEEGENDGGSECLWAAVGQLSVGSPEDPVGNKNAVKEEPPATKEQENEEEEEEVMKLLLFYVEMSSEESKEVAIVQLSDLRQTAPEQLVKFLESNIEIIDEEESDDTDGKSVDLGTI